MSVDIGPMYKELAKHKIYGHLPTMAACSHAQLGALNAKSFCERILSCADNLIKSDNTLLDDIEIEMVVTLRMNRDFMEFMRANYANMLREQFGMTIAE